MADGMPDFSSMSDEQLQALAGDQAPAPAPAPAQAQAPAAAPDFSKMTDQELEALAGQGKPLSNVPGEGTESALAKGTATAAIKGLANIPAVYGPGTANFADYLLARAHSFITGEKVEDILDRYKKQDIENAKNDPLYRFAQSIAPQNVIPTGEQIAAPIFARTGEYKPQTALGRAGMAGVETVTGLIGPGGGMRGAGAPTTGFLNEAINVAKDAAKNAPTAFASGAAGEAATEATGDPLAGLAAGIAVPAVGGKVISGVTSPIKNYIAPMLPSQRAGIAGEKLLSQSTSPEQTIAAGLMPARTEAFGPETLGENAGDIGLLQAQKAARATSPQFDAAMQAREAQQNAARLGTIEGLAPETADIMKPSEVLTQHAANIDAAEQAAIQGLQNNADAIHASMPEGTMPEETGNSLRTLMQEVSNAARKTRSDLYGAVDPTGNLSVVTRNASQAAKDLRASIDPDVSIPSPHATEVINKVANLSDVTPYSKLIELDKTITAKMAEANRAGDYTGNGQLRQMKQAVMDDINKAVENQHAWEQEAVNEGRLNPDNTMAARLRVFGANVTGTAGETSGKGAVGVAATGTTGLPPTGLEERPSGAGLRGVEGAQGVQGLQPAPTSFEGDLNNYTIHYPAGQLQARYELADAKNLVSSHDTDFRENPAYPQELQSRDRGSASSQTQINSIANNLKPELLGPSKISATGAPIVGPDNVVESGNGRVLGVSKAYETGRGNAYRAWLERNGYNTAGMEKPILVARRTSPMTPEERRIFVESSNSSTGLRMNASEQAESDAKMIAKMRTPLEPGAISSAANRPFIREFMSKLPLNEQGSILDADQALSADGERRISAAVARRAYGDSSLIDRAFVSGDNNMKNVTGALTDTAGIWHEMRQAAANGEIPADHDITKQVMDTVKQIMRAKDEGKTIGDIFRQNDMFRDPQSDAVSKMFSPDGNRLAGRAKIAEALQNYAEQALKNRTEATMFGEALPSVSTRDILENVVGKIEKEPLEEPTAPAAAPEAEAPKGEYKPLLTPNFDERAAARLAEAKKAHADFAQTYRKGPVGQVLKEDGFQGQYKVPDSAVVGKAFTTGDKGYEATKSFIDAAKRAGVDNTSEVVSTLQDIAVTRLREMMKGADLLTPKVLQQWQQKYAQSLRAIDEASPGFSKKFSNLADATDALAKAQARQVGLAKSSQLGVAGKLINATTPDEVVRNVGQMLGASDGATQIKNLLTKIKQDPSLPQQEAIDGLRRAGVKHMMDTLTNAGKVGEENALSGAKLRNFMNRNSDALKALYGDDGFANMDRLARDMERTQTLLDAVKVKYGSDTAKNLSYIDKFMKSNGHDMSIGGAFGIAGLEAFQHFGITGALAVGAAAAAKVMLGKLRAHGMNKVNDIYEQALLNPKDGAALMQKALDNRGMVKKDAMNKLVTRLVASTEGAMQSHKDQEDKREDLLQRKALGRASGGRVFDISDRLVRDAEKAKKAESNTTEQLLDLPDDYIAHALNAAQAAI
jgi:ddrB-like ParB superfamily domain